ncbi:RNA polymerase factor sigma-54 [Cerasicoccus fimbriatus]|uniref:RNA polymerase factor sigma-54 n=1 Tax=Cerasicoccus fimbriatus TaxID=3014554 RepID=UPI0022B40E84|nr:RNA polymerase factor sigma-54 [Cerasicoccus sp. TK19100]
MAHQGLQQVQKQTQSLVLAPQLRQSLKILQAATLELRNSILEELQQNPTLEELPVDGISIEQQASEDKETNDSEPASTDEMQLSEEDYSKLSQLDEDYREYYTQEASNSQFTSEDAQRRQHFFDSLVSETSLQEHLLRQADLCDLTPQQKEGVDYLIGSLDDRGFLTISLSDAALMTQLPLGEMQKAADVLKSLDPPGIGAKDLQDCLLTQLKLTERDDTLAAEIIRDHYELLLRHRIPDIARKTSSKIEEVQFAIEEIATLDPAPGSKFSDDNNRIVVPDVTVEKSDDTWQIILNNDYIPRLRISPAYKEMIATGKIIGKDKEYIREKIRAGRFLMNSIEQRQQTIERITEEILKFQLDFFEYGVSKLRPLTMNQIAQTVGVHETTVSRAIANKFIETPHGVFEFKYFFTPGYQGKDGQAVSNKSIKDRIANIISNENPAKPLSDQEVVKILAQDDVKIARRTVAKYREELGILPTNLRRRFQ